MSNLDKLTGIGQEFLLDNDGDILAEFIDGNFSTRVLTGNREGTLSLLDTVDDESPTLNDQRVYFIAILMGLGVAATGCGSSSDVTGSNDPKAPTITQPTAPVSTPSVPVVTPSAPAPVCKAFNSIWYTLATPENAVMGQYSGPPTDGPVYVLDLTKMQTGEGYTWFKTDSIHACLYGISLNADRFIVETFQGCNIGVIPPGGAVNDQCNYCPYFAPSAQQLNLEFDVKLTCTSLTITDKSTAKSITYY